MKEWPISTIVAIVLFAIIEGYILLQIAIAAPTGATFDYNLTSGTPNATPANRSNGRGTITTVILNAVQQDQNWKGYVGNVTGRLSLDDGSGNTLYDWPISTLNKTGEVYVTRALSPVWENVSCINDDNITAEHTFHNMSSPKWCFLIVPSRKCWEHFRAGIEAPLCLFYECNEIK